MYGHSKLFWKSYYLLSPVQKTQETLTNFVITNNQITSKIFILNIQFVNFHLLILEPTSLLLPWGKDITDALIQKWYLS